MIRVTAISRRYPRRKGAVTSMKYLPRILFGAPSSGEGKTTVTCAVLRALVGRKMNPVAFKCGPDYIDPMFHSRVIGARSRNLDLFMMGAGTVRNALWENGKTGSISIIEGAMGFYDGIAVSSDASSWDLAVQTRTPVVLVLDGHGRALSTAAEVKGFLQFREPSRIEGVILNRVSPVMYSKIAEVIEKETGVKLFGFLPESEEFKLESRHLGLVTADEVENLRGKLDAMAARAEKTIDLNGLIELANSAPPFHVAKESLPGYVEERPRIAVARDRAFCFYYEDALALLERLGAELVEFSPMLDMALPEGCTGMYLGGGYPELYGKELSENDDMCECVRKAVEAGMPTIAECGGFLYLCSVLEDGDGEKCTMAGVLCGEAYRTNKLTRFGYVTLTAKKDGLLFKKGDTISGHEFHYWDCDMPGDDFRARKPQSRRSWNCGYSTESMYAGFPHIHLLSSPESALRFVLAASEWNPNRKGETPCRD